MAEMQLLVPSTFATYVFTPQEVARLFCQLHAGEQGEFFNTIAEEVDTWGDDFKEQLQSVIDSCKLDAGGIDVMRTIGEYGQSALPKREAPDDNG